MVVCKRCNNDIDSSAGVCPVCGLSTKTHITPRDYSNIQVSRKGGKKRNIMSIIAMLVAIAGVFTMVTLSGRETEKADFQRIVDAYQAGDDQLVLLSVGQYIKKYPKSDRIEEAEWYLKDIRGIDDSIVDSDSDDPETAAELLRQAEIERLKSVAKAEIVSIEKMVVGKPRTDTSVSLELYWRNMSKKTVKEIQFRVVAYDADGNEAKCTDRNRADLTARTIKAYPPNPTGDVYRNIWLEAWFNDTVDHAKITRVRIIYEDDSFETLPTEVIDSITSFST